MSDIQSSPNPCFMGIYFVGWVLMYLCPVIGQLMGIRILCNHDKYLGHPNKSERVMARIPLILCTYGIGYALIYGLYYVIKWYIQGWEWSLKKENYGEKECSKGKFGVLFLSFGLYSVYWIIAKYIDLWKYGISNYKKPLGRIGLFFASFGLYFIWLLIEGYMNLWKFGLVRVKLESKCDQFLGHIVLTLVTFGLYIIYKALEGYINLFKNGIKWRYEDDDDDTITNIGGGLLLTVLTCGLFIIFELLVQYINLWSLAIWNTKKDTLKEKAFGHFLITILSCGIYIPIRLVYQYYRGWVYGLQYFNDNEEHIKAKLMLFGVSCGLYGFVQLGFWYIDAWKYGIAKRTDENWNERMKGHLTLLAVSLLTYSLFLLGVLYCDGWEYGIKFYNDAENKKNNVWGGILLIIVTFGLFSIFYLGVLYIRLWRYGISQYYFGSDEIDHSNQVTIKNIWGGFILTICSCGLFLLFQLGSWYCRLFVYSYDQYSWKYIETINNSNECSVPVKNTEYEEDSDSVEMKAEYDIEATQSSEIFQQTKSNNSTERRVRIIWGSLLLTILTCGLFIIFQLVKWYIELIINNWKNVKHDKESNISQTSTYISHIILTVCTLGMYLIFQYIYQIGIINECIKSPPDSDKNKLGWNKIYYHTLGIGFIVKNLYSKDKYKRYPAQIALTILTGGMFILYELIGYVWYNNTCRCYMNLFLIYCEESKNYLKHWFELNISHPAYIKRIHISNFFGEISINTSNYCRGQYAAFCNWRITGNHIQSDNAEYVPAHAELFVPIEIIPMKTFEEKTEARVTNGIIEKYGDKAFEALCIIQAHLRVTHRDRFGYEPFKHDIMYIERSAFASLEFPIIFDLVERVELSHYALAELKYKDLENCIPKLGSSTEEYSFQYDIYKNTHKKIKRRIKFLKDLVKKETDIAKISHQLNKIFEMNNKEYNVDSNYDYYNIFRNNNKVFL